MSEKPFWLVCWQLPDNLIYSRLIGSEKEFLDTKLNKIKYKVKNLLLDFDINSLEEYKIKIIPVSLSLSYKDQKRNFPVPYQITLEVAAVYGKNKDFSNYICYLPYLNFEFIYFSEEQLTSLVEFYVQKEMNNLSPEECLRLIMPGKPWLEKVLLNKKNNQKSGAIHYRESHSNILLHADRFPEKGPKERITRILPDVAWERKEIIDSIVTLITKEKLNVIVVGETGTGKSSIIKESMKVMANNKEIESTFWKTNSNRLIANARYLGEWQENCELLVDSLVSANGYLYVVDIIQLLFIGGEDVSDSVAAYLLPFLKSGDLKLIGEMTQSELNKAFHLLPGFMELFHIYHINEMDSSDVQKIVKLYSSYIEKNHKISFTNDASDLAYRLVKRYIFNEKFPGKMVRFLSECTGYAIQEKIPKIEFNHINKVFTKVTGLPELMIRDDITFKENQLLDYFRSKIVGQDQAIQHLCSVVHSFKSGLNAPGKPIATLLFSGPTGVGKTASAKALAEYFFGAGQRRDPLFRLDMSEFQNAFQVRRLVGMDAKSPSKLIQHVRNNPFSVILLDEIEKADPSFFDVLMAMMDEGIFTDGTGKEVSFKSTIIILTTNLGNTNTNIMGFSKQEPDFAKAIKNYFRPEFVNRIDQVLFFKSLDEDSIYKITLIELEKLDKREGLAIKEIKLSFSEELIRWISKIGYHPTYGARPLQRAIEQKIVSNLGRHLLKNPNLRKCNILIDFIDDEVCFL